MYSSALVFPLYNCLSHKDLTDFSMIYCGAVIKASNFTDFTMTFFAIEYKDLEKLTAYHMG